jgi:hypothetical protein
MCRTIDMPRFLPLLRLQVSIVIEQLLRLLHHCGMPRTDADLIHGNGRVVNELLLRAQPRSTLFTGSQRVAEKLAIDMRGKVRLGLRCGCCLYGGCAGGGQRATKELTLLMACRCALWWHVCKRDDRQVPVAGTSQACVPNLSPL